MQITQIVMVLDTIIANPGLTYKQLEKKIEARYGKENLAVRCMYLGVTDKDSHLRILIKDIYCIEKKGGRYYCNPALPLTDRTDIKQVYIEGRLLEKKKILTSPHSAVNKWGKG